MDTASLLDWIAAVSQGVTAAGVALVGWQACLMKKETAADHERSRRETTWRVISEWNGRINSDVAVARTFVASLSLEQARALADFRDLTVTEDQFALVQTCLAGIEAVAHGAGGNVQLNRPHVARLRFLAAEYLIALESTLCSWYFAVVDRPMFEAEFAYLLDPKTDETLKAYRAIRGESNFPATLAFLHQMEKGFPKLATQRELVG